MNLCRSTKPLSNKNEGKRENSRLMRGMSVVQEGMDEIGFR
jgi:hypothetical protein